ncbi:sensor histidine kinase [Psychromonas sp. KJ10-10]|uniref:sensor histidine kinase n=1 Tax=Psychromonas sp. KJ10-10 TaxID=3391823 RepID=UPI0039B406F1
MIAGGEVNALTALLPNYSNVSIYLLNLQPDLSIDDNKQLLFANDSELIQQQKQLAYLNKQLDKKQKTAIFQSSPRILTNNQVITFQHAPIFIQDKLIGYLQARLNITQLLDAQIDQSLIHYPFALSETGNTIYSLLPQDSLINDVKEQMMLPILGHEWKLMVWAKHQRHFYRYTLIIGILLSVLLAMVCHLTQVNRRMSTRLKIKKQNLVKINKDFKASKSKLRQSNKLSSLGEIAAGIAHEINQPLQVISIHSEICNESLQRQDYQMADKSFLSILSQVDRIEKIVKQVGSFARDSELDNYNTALPIDIFENVINIVINQYNQENVELRQVLPSSLPPILCNKTQIEQVLINLLINAKDAVEHSSEKVVFIKAHDKQGKLYIEISDSGSGIEANKLDEIFAPFYTTKALGKGTGLGLSISYSIIHQHKGELQVSSELGKGSRFTVILPLN